MLGPVAMALTARRCIRWRSAASPASVLDAAAGSPAPAVPPLATLAGIRAIAEVESSAAAEQDAAPALPRPSVMVSPAMPALALPLMKTW